MNNNIIISHQNDTLAIVLQSRVTSDVVGYMLASLDHSNVYSVVRVVAESGLGIATYKVAMMYLNTQGMTLTNSGDEMNNHSRKVWERLQVDCDTISTPLNNLPSMGGLPLFLSEDLMLIDDDSFLNNSYTVTPTEDFNNSITPCSAVVTDVLVNKGEQMFFKRYYE